MSFELIISMKNVKAILYGGLSLLAFLKLKNALFVDAALCSHFLVFDRAIKSSQFVVLQLAFKNNMSECVMQKDTGHSMAS